MSQESADVPPGSADDVVPLELIAYRVSTFPPYRIVKAAVDRAWMDATGERFAYRCLPLNVANTNGWMILNCTPFKAMWTGGWDKTSVKVVPLEEGGHVPAIGHFGSGVLTFHIPWLFRTPEGWNMHAHGPANHIKDAIAPLEGVIETDWSIAPFTFNWKFNAKNVWTTFEQDEPICMLTPFRRGDVEKLSGREVAIEDDAELNEAYTKWRDGRGQFLKDLGKPGTEATANKWERHYFKGIKRDGTAAPTHQTRLDVKEFRMLPRAEDGLSVGPPMAGQEQRPPQPETGQYEVGLTGGGQAAAGAIGQATADGAGSGPGGVDAAPGDGKCPFGYK